MVILTQHTTRVSILMVLVALLLMPGLALAGGQSEAGDGHSETEEHGHAEDHGGLPHVEAVTLEPGEELRVVATTNIIGDVVRNVVGDAAEITILISAGQDPHGYTPTPRAVAAIERAHVVFVNGFGLEENLLDTVETTSTGHVVPVSAGIMPIGGNDHGDDYDDDHAEDHDEHGDDHDDDHGEDHDEHGDDHDDDHGDDHDEHGDDHGDDHDEHGDDHDHDHSAGDPHVWFDPNNVMIWAENIAEIMGDLLPEQQPTFSQAADAYTDALRELDTDTRRRIAEIPQGRRKLVIDHASLDYFAERYGMTVVGTVIPSTSSQAEPSAQAISQLVEVIRRENAPAIFVGASASRGLQNLSRAVADEVGREINIGTLLTGSLTAEGGVGDSYLAFMEYNVTQIVENLAD